MNHTAIAELINNNYLQCWYAIQQDCLYLQEIKMY